MDLYEKVNKAKDIKGTRFIHVFTPCPPGWRFPTGDTIKIGKLAVETGLVILSEVEDGIFRLTAASKALARRGTLKPVKDYFALQGRFRNLTEEQIKELQDLVNARWKQRLERASNRDRLG